MDGDMTFHEGCQILAFPLLTLQTIKVKTAALNSVLLAVLPQLSAFSACITLPADYCQLFTHGKALPRDHTSKHVIYKCTCQTLPAY